MSCMSLHEQVVEGGKRPAARNKALEDHLQGLFEGYAARAVYRAD